MLDVWSFNGLFFEPEITAEYAGQPLTVLSSDNGKYIFNTPDECRFALTVIVPQGAEVTVNGKKLGSAERAGSARLPTLRAAKHARGFTAHRDSPQAQSRPNMTNTQWRAFLLTRL